METLRHVQNDPISRLIPTDAWGPPKCPSKGGRDKPGIIRLEENSKAYKKAENAVYIRQKITSKIKASTEQCKENTIYA